MPERILSALAYLTFGTIGLVLMIVSVISKTSLKPFVRFNSYQAILIGFLFFFIQTTYLLIDSIFQLLGLIPFIGRFIYSFFQAVIYYLMGFPVCLGFSILATIVIATIVYLTILALMGKLPYIPYISNAIKGIIK
ncbi:MAG: hypothetical protein K6A44_00230 [bacterium]|nr:hypothetical protein [bacterium]